MGVKPATKVTNDDLAKLPKWAQRFVQYLERRLQEANELIEELRTRDGETKVWYDGRWIGSSTEKIYLPDDARITFELDNGDQLVVGKREANHLVPAHIELYLSQADKPLVTFQQAMNVVHVFTIEREGRRS